MSNSCVYSVIYKINFIQDCEKRRLIFEASFFCLARYARFKRKAFNTTNSELKDLPMAASQGGT